MSATGAEAAGVNEPIPTEAPLSAVALEWTAAATALLEDLMRSGPPPSMAEGATRAVYRASERAARERGATGVEPRDVARGCLRVAPPIFRPDVQTNLARRGLLSEAIDGSDKNAL